MHKPAKIVAEMHIAFEAVMTEAPSLHVEEKSDVQELALEQTDHREIVLATWDAMFVTVPAT